MQHVRLGRTGLQVSRICLGTMTFGLQVEEDASRAILDKAAGAGGMLSGKHDRTKTPDEGTRFALGNAAQTYQDRYWHDNVCDHRAHRRREPSGTTRRDDRGRRRAARSRSRRSLERGHGRVPAWRRAALASGT